MAVFMLDDVAGAVEVVVFPETFGKHGSLIEADAMVLVRGKFEKDDESARIVATELMPIAALKERTTREVIIHLANKAQRNTLEQLAELLSRHRGDRRVFLELDVNGQERPLRVRSRGRAAGEAVGTAGARSRAVVRLGIDRIEITASIAASSERLQSRQQFAYARRTAGIRRTGRRAPEGDRGAQHDAADARAGAVHREPPQPRRRDPQRALREPHAVAARAGGASPEPARTRSTTSSGCSPTGPSCTATAGSPTTTPS